MGLLLAGPLDMRERKLRILDVTGLVNRFQHERPLSLSRGLFLRYARGVSSSDVFVKYHHQL